MPFPDRIGAVYIPSVLGIQGAQRSVDAPGGPDRVRVAVRTLAQRKDVHALPRQLDSRPEPSRPGPDDEHPDLNYLMLMLTVLHASHTPKNRKSAANMLVSPANLTYKVYGVGWRSGVIEFT